MRHLVLISALGFAGAISAWASVDSGLLALAPAGTKIIGAVDVKHARNSEFGQYLLAKAQADDGHFQEMISETGFDPRRDLQSILFASGGPLSGGQAQTAFAILARGTFDQSKIKASAVGKGGAKIVTYGGVDMIVHEGSDAGDLHAIAFLDGGVAVMADVNTLKQIIDSRAAPSILDADLKAKIQSVGSVNDAWYVSMVNGASFLGGHADGPQQARALQGVVQSSGGVKFGATIDVTIDATTRSEKDAQSLADVIRFGAGMLQMQRQNDSRMGILASALDAMTLQNTGAAVHFAVSLPEKSLEQLADAAGGSHGAAH